LFGTHIRWRANPPPTLAEILILEGEPEVGDTGPARGIDEDVGGLDVPVDQPPGVGVMQGVGDRGDQFRRIPEGRTTLTDPDRKVAALHQLGDHEAETILRATDVMDRNDVRVVQPGEDTGFVQVGFHILGMTDTLGVRHLDGDRSVEVIIVRQVDSPEPALAETADDPVAPDPGGIMGRGLA
jgi:hypothetical protein